MSGDKAQFEPKILGFLCNWCSYAGADLAGVSRVQYPTNLKAIRVMCSGRVDPVQVLQALIRGIDGVLIAGCHPGDCHYQTGNYQTKRRFDALKEALRLTDLEEERAGLEWISASEGVRFGEVVRDITERLRELGPSPAGKRGARGERIRRQLRALERFFGEHRTRTLIGKQGELTEKGNVYGERIDPERYRALISEALRDGYVRNYVMVSAADEPRSVKELARELDVAPRRVLREIKVLRRRNMVALHSVKGTTPRYLSQEGWER